MLKISIAAAFLLFSFSSVLAQDSRSCPSSLSESDKNACCENLNKARDDFSTCCDYPIMVVYRDDYDACSEECSAGGQNSSRCCILSCCFARLNITTSEVGVVSATGLANSFLMSVGNPDAWAEKINCVVGKCTAQLSRQPPEKATDEYANYWDCFEKIPMYFYDIVDCAYDNNYIYCPSYPFNTGKCHETYYYVNDCFLNGAGICGATQDPRSSGGSGQGGGGSGGENNGGGTGGGGGGENSGQNSTSTGGEGGN